MYTLINGSPKVVNSNSINFLNKIKKELTENKIFELKNNEYEGLIENINNSEVVVLAFPLYVDSPPSIVLKFLDYVIDNNIYFENKSFYIIINCGFREGTQNITALNIIKNWCDKVKAIYNGSILVGAGEIVGKDKFKYISKKALKKLYVFSNCIKNNEKSDDIITTMDLLNNRLYCFFANKSWTRKGNKNNLSKKDIIKK